MRNLTLSALILASAFQTALGQIVEGQWTYIVENGGATITRSTATGDVTIPSSLGEHNVKKLGTGSAPIFSRYNSVTSVVIPSGVTSIGLGGFLGCEALTSVTIPESVTNIGSLAFSGCTSLASIITPNNVTSIGSYAFWNCTGLISVVIGGGITSIGDYAFADCTSITTLTIPINVTSIGVEAFLRCASLVAVYMPARFETTYQDFGLTSSQVSFYDSSSTSYLAGQQSVINNPSAHNLYTATQYAANFTAGRNDVITSPNSNGLYTTSQIHYMAMGDLVLTRQEDGIFVLNYDIDQSTDLQNWTPYVSCHLPLEYLPEDKAFVRIKMLNLTPYPPIAAPTPPRDPSATPIGSNF